jgi:glycosyltransferase involved in cell wall biosynthesis
MIDSNLLQEADAGISRCIRLHPHLNILLVSTADLGGGAEASAWNLVHAYRELGHESRLAVRTRKTEDASVVLIPGDSCRNVWARSWIQAGNQLRIFENRSKWYSRLHTLFRWIAEPRRRLEWELGHEDFDFPGTWQIFRRGVQPDIVHCFNLHEGYFDLRIMPWLSRQRPVILDLRDAWLLSGHCAHSVGCDGWITGCGNCPNLKLYPAICRDGTAYNWERKRSIFAKSRVYVSTPSRWLMEKAQQSILKPAIVESRIIPTGIDLSIFHPADKKLVRSQLGLPQNARILLFAANGIRRNIWKHYQTLQDAFRLLSERMECYELIFIALGEAAPNERIGKAQILFVPHLKDPESVARYYQAADLYVHAATADTFPRTVLEALACGSPVVATAVGGIPEQINSLENVHSLNGATATGILVPPGDPQSMAIGIEKLLTTEFLHRMLSNNATRDARDRFDLRKQADCYLDWYRSILNTRQPCAGNKDAD